MTELDGATVTRFVDAVKAGDVASLELVRQEPGLLLVETDWGVPPVMLAAYLGHTDLAGAMLQHGAEPDVFVAAALGLHKELRSLLTADAGAIGAYSSDGWTALHLAGHFGQTDAAAVLLDAGADLAALSRNRNGNTPLHAALAGRRTETARLLIQRGADVSATDAQGWRPIHLAAANGDVASVRLLLERGADPAADNDAGQTAGTLAGANGHEAIVDLLKEHGAAA